MAPLPKGSRARYAVVTPYYREPRETLERCIASVTGQTVQADHFVIADGFPQDWLDRAVARHVRLPRAHDDYGNAARGFGALLAVAAGYEGIGFLDADNWYDPEHVERCTATGGALPQPADAVIAAMRLVRPDGTLLPAAVEANHIDTSCYWFCEGAYPLLHYWMTMPREVAGIGDRVFAKMIRERRLFLRQLAKPTVNYCCMWESLYRSVGEEPPPGAKPNIDSGTILAWYRALPEPERRRVTDLCGTSLAL